MRTIKLEDAVTKRVTKKVVAKPELRALVCDGCGVKFDMRQYCNDDLTPGKLVGTFEASVDGPDGRGLGNMFEATVCSFKCAHEVHTGGWKKMPDYAPYVKHKVELARVELGLTTIVSEAELRKEWKSGKRAREEAMEEERASVFRDLASPSLGGGCGALFGYPRIGIPRNPDGRRAPA